MIICYCAVFKYDTDGINITFPDIPGCFTCAYSREEAVVMSKDVLNIFLHGKKITDLPKATAGIKLKAAVCEEIVEISINMGVKDGVLSGFDIVELV